MIREDFVRLMDRIANQQTMGRSIGFHDLDRLIHGIGRNESILFASRPGIGATTLAISILSNLAMSGTSAVLVTNESPEESALKMLSALSKIPTVNLRRGLLRDVDWPRLAQSADQVSKLDLQFIQAGSSHSYEAPELKNPSFVIFDQVNVDYETARSKYPESRFIFFETLDSKIDSRPNKRPMLRDLSYDQETLASRCIAVVFIYRNEFYNRWENEDKGIAELIVAKNRKGDTDTIRVAFLPEYNLFANLAKDSDGPVPSESVAGGADARTIRDSPF